MARMSDVFDDIDDDDGPGDNVNGSLTVTLSPENAGDRLDRVLTALFPDLSRARLQALIAEGRLSFDGVAVTEGKHKAKAGDYTLTIPAPVSATPEPQDIPLDILFEDAHLIVVNKPVGMAAHPAPGTRDGTLVNALLFHCANPDGTSTLSGIGGLLRPGIVHRLDKDTSGILVAAKSDAAHRGLSALFAKHDIDREYKAVVRGAPKYMSGTVTTQIGRSHHDRKKMAVLRAGGREAITHYRLEEVFGTTKPLAALLSCRLETGRTHQIRVHMAHLGCPCLGDPVYGSGAPARQVREILDELGFDRQALHAGLLGFVHPITGEKLKFKAPMPNDMQELVDTLAAIGDEDYD